jgi:uncharacterized protein (DUF58 family)
MLDGRAKRARSASPKWARLNHILIPKTKAERDRFRQTPLGRLMIPVFAFWGALTDEGRTLAIVAPIVGAVSVDVQRTSAYVFASLLVGVVLGSLVAARWLVLDRATVTVRAPRRVTVGDEVVFHVACRRETGRETGLGEDGASDDPLPIRVRGPFLPWDGTWTAVSPSELLLGAGNTVETTMQARFVSRGLHHLDPFSAAIVLPLGLACGPRTWSDGVKVHVVPRIANVRSLPPTIATKHQPGGVALASKAGESMDLLGVRPYRPGDPVRDLHARTWARTGAPAVREYQQEYFTRVGVILDTAARDPDLLEASLELAAGVVAHLSRGEALIDVLVVGDVVHELTLGRSLGRLDQALELLAAVERGPKLDAKKLVKRLEPHLARLSSVVAIVGDAPTTEREILENELRDHGLACTTLVVDAKLASAIQAREELAW